MTGFLEWSATAYCLFMATIFTIRRMTSLPGGGSWVFLGWVCAARDSKLASRSKKNSPKIDTPF